MKMDRIKRGIFSLCGMFLISGFLACEPGRQTAQTGQQPINEMATTGGASEVYDERINTLNEEFTNLERDLVASDRAVQEGFREDWRDLEVKRLELNRNISLYNSAVERGATLEASEIRADINRLLGELEGEVREFRSDYGTETEISPGTGTQMPEQQQDFEQQQEFPNQQNYPDDYDYPQNQ
jgi:hypothetical protein